MLSRRIGDTAFTIVLSPVLTSHGTVQFKGPNLQVLFNPLFVACRDNERTMHLANVEFLYVNVNSNS